MTTRLPALTGCLAALLLTSPLASAQAPAGPGGMGQGGMMQQMSAMMERMAVMLGTK